MKKIIIILTLFCAVVFAQSEQKIAVYVTGEMGVNEKEALSTKMLSSLVGSGKYKAIESVEKTNASEPSQIIAFGKQFGAQFVCLVNIKPAFDSYHVSARIIDTETSEVMIIGETSSTLKSFDDLANVTNELSVQLLKQPSQSTAATIPAAEEQKQCDKKYNINELIFKIQSSFSVQLKECGTTLAKNMALASSPFGKKTAQPEPKSFMLQCTIDGMKAKLPLGFPNMDKITDNIQNFVQTLLNESSANGQLDTKKLLKAIDEMKIDGLLGVIKDFAIGNACIVDEPYEGEVVVSENKQADSSVVGYENFTTGQRIRTIILNVFPFSYGLGSGLIMSDWRSTFIQLGIGASGLALAITGEAAFKEEKCYGDRYRYCDKKTSDAGKVIIVIGASAIVGGGLYGIYNAITYDKPQSVGYENFTVVQRITAVALNAFPFTAGLGSGIVMGDWKGTFIEWGIAAGGGALMGTGMLFADKEENSFGSYHYKPTPTTITFFAIGGTVIATGYIYGIYRAITYDKPKNVAYNSNSGFNFTILPNSKGNGFAYGLFYGVGF